MRDAKPEAESGRYRVASPSRRRGAGRPGSPRRSWPSRPQTSAGAGPTRRPQAAQRHSAYDCSYALFSARRTPRRKAALTGWIRIFGASRRRFRDAGLRRFSCRAGRGRRIFSYTATHHAGVAVGFIGISSGVGYWLWLWALTNATPTRVTVFLSLSPITAALLGLLLLGETLSIPLLAGLGAVMAGLWLAHRD